MTTIKPNKTFRVFGRINNRAKYTIHDSRGSMVAYGYNTYEDALIAADKMFKAYKIKRKEIKAWIAAGRPDDFVFTDGTL